MRKNLNNDPRRLYYEKLGAPAIQFIHFVGVFLVVLPFTVINIESIYIQNLLIIFWMLLFPVSFYILNYLGPYVGYIKEFPSMKERLLYIRKVSKQHIFTFGGRQRYDIYSNINKEEYFLLILELVKEYIEYNVEYTILLQNEKYKQLTPRVQFCVLSYILFENKLIEHMYFTKRKENRELISEIFHAHSGIAMHQKKYTKEQIVDLGFGGFISEKPSEMTEILKDVQMSENMYKELISFLINNLSSKDKIQYEKLTKKNEYVKLSNEEKVNVLCSFMPSLINNDTYEEYFKTLKYKNKVLGEEINQKLKTMRYLSDEELYKLNLYETLKG